MIVLTRPTARRARTSVRHRVGAAVAAARRPPRRPPGVGGPLAVVSSVSRGLTALSLPFELNPRRLGDAETMVVLSDLGALEEAIAWKRRSGRRRLLAGPNLVVLPSDAAPLVTAPEIDVFLVPCEWSRRLYEEDAPELKGRLAIWPAGVDESRWKPAEPQPERPRRALIYRKDLPGQRSATDLEMQSTRRALEQTGFSVTTLGYGTFDHDRYIDELHASDVVVFFSPTESQCLAQVEAWSTDVPTLVWSCGLLEYRGRSYRSSSAPYLSLQTGREFEDVPALEGLLSRWNELRATFAPRRWVLDHMTDEISARALWDIAHRPSRPVVTSSALSAP